VIELVEQLVVAVHDEQVTILRPTAVDVSGIAAFHQCGCVMACVGIG
jgi:hypothetical protein